MLGFVAGTLVFALLALADRFSPSHLLFTSCLAGAACNVLIIWLARDSSSLIVLRFLTGFCIAGIYPVGMKIAADWYEKGLGKALGFLVGALVFGTAFPYLLKNRDFELPWRSVLIYTSVFAIIGGLIILFFVGDGPYRKASGKLQWTALEQIFASKKWRQAAFGYFGHMWELYTFWGFLPVIISLYADRNHLSLDTSLISFLVIAAGGIGCMVGGYISEKTGSARVASVALFISGLCCLVSPLWYSLPPWLFLSLLVIWGFAVCPDSPQFSTLAAQYAPAHLRGTALTIYNSIGFLITSLSLFIFDRLIHSGLFLSGTHSFPLLALGALFGLPFILKLARR